MSARPLRYPRPCRLIDTAGGGQFYPTTVFVEEGGVRIDNAGPFTMREAIRLRLWLDRYIAVARRAEARRRRAR